LLERIYSEFNDQLFQDTIVKLAFIDSSQHSQLGCDFGAKIKSEIDSSDCVLAIISEHTLASCWVNQEIGYTIGKGIDLVPIKQKSLSNSGCGFLHSNIDCQLYTQQQRKFPKLNAFFNNRYSRKGTEVLTTNPSIIKPVKEKQTLRTRKVS
jgi:hypothetical protein